MTNHLGYEKHDGPGGTAATAATAVFGGQAGAADEVGLQSLLEGCPGRGGGQGGAGRGHELRPVDVGPLLSPFHPLSCVVLWGRGPC